MKKRTSFTLLALALGVMWLRSAGCHVLGTGLPAGCESDILEDARSYVEKRGGHAPLQLMGVKNVRWDGDDEVRGTAFVVDATAQWRLTFRCEKRTFMGWRNYSMSGGRDR